MILYLFFIYLGHLTIESFFHKMFSYLIFSKKLSYLKFFHKTLFVGILESASLRVEMLVEVRLPTRPTLGEVIVVVVIVE